MISLFPPYPITGIAAGRCGPSRCRAWDAPAALKTSFVNRKDFFNSIGHHLTGESAESVLPSITDLGEMRWRVRFVPNCDIAVLFCRHLRGSTAG